MSVKVSLSTEVIKENKFPKLMVGYNGAIVLFEEYAIGTLIEPGLNSYYIGWHHNAWIMDYFKDYEGEVILKNE